MNKNINNANNAYVLFDKLEKYLMKGSSILLPLFLLINFNIYPFEIIYSRVLTWCAVTILVFLINPLKLSKKYNWIRFVDYIIILFLLFVFLFFYKELDIMIDGLGFKISLYQVIISTLTIIVVLEATRRAAGPVLPIMAILLIIYALHKGYDYNRILVEIVSYDGIFGMVFSLAISIVFMFMMFGSVLNEANFGNFILKFGTTVAGGQAGGPAKVAVIASSIFGTISGSAVANVVGTGTFTIPMMKKLGFKPEVAGATESAASTGGMIMPPVMAAAAFIMAEILAVPYIEIAKAAILPAIAYFISVYIGVDSYAKINGLKGMPKNERPSLKDSLSSGGHLSVIILVLIYMLANNITPMRVAFLCTLIIFPISFLAKATRLNAKKIINALIGASDGLLVLVPCCATIGIIIAIIGVTGLSGQIANSIVSIGGQNTLLVLILVMCTCIIFGMALPATASYLVCISIVGPALIKLGIEPIAAHLFTLYFAVLSGITPPVAMAAFAAAGIAEGNMFKTAINACYLASSSFLVPYIFVYNPAMVLKGSTVSMLLTIIPYVIILPVALSWGLWRYKRFSRNLLINEVINFGTVLLLAYTAIRQQLDIGNIIALLWVSMFLINNYLNKRKGSTAL